MFNFSCSVFYKFINASFFCYLFGPHIAVWYGGGFWCVSLHYDKLICLLSSHSFSGFLLCFCHFGLYWFSVIIRNLILFSIVPNYFFILIYPPTLSFLPSLLFLLESFKFAWDFNLWWIFVFMVVLYSNFSFTVYQLF